jgi:hypothetical protein
MTVTEIIENLEINSRRDSEFVVAPFRQFHGIILGECDRATKDVFVV